IKHIENYSVFQVKQNLQEIADFVTLLNFIVVILKQGCNISSVI
ncbi:hypothetical protein HMPREF0506_1424, partial [Lactobacillus crispatus JV-V01]